ncbi:hypothetical protein MRB53_008481 [Persea americana]|uniref:Uncharacterized protein n=1 Tax=Persea americana TaxID=3435 RepID=A0ACC2MM90_PERAE|nr:hypothetical protein MRB53_008481 [Persea americana]
MKKCGCQNSRGKSCSVPRTGFFVLVVRGSTRFRSLRGWGISEFARNFQNRFPSNVFMSLSLPYEFSAKTNRKSCCFVLSILRLFSSSQVFVGVIEQRSLGFFVRETLVSPILGE